MFVQLSDLHISPKNNSRLITAFRQLKSNIGDLPLIIAGDIFNSKVRLSQDDISTFHTMINIFSGNEIHIIPGNHDFNYGDMTNLISTVVTGTAYPNLHVYSTHTLVEIGSSWFAFIPPTDYNPPDGIINQLQGKPGAKYIVVHEPIIGCKYYANSTYTSARINTSLLQITAILAGDIHKHSILVVNNTRVVFSGSLVQKNISEVQDHGYVVWRNNTPEFFRIQDGNRRLRFYHKEGCYVEAKSAKYTEITADIDVVLVFKSCSKNYIDLVKQQMITEHSVNINRLQVSEVSPRTAGFSTQIANISASDELASLKTHLGLLTKTLMRDKKTGLIESINNLHSNYYNSVFTPRSVEITSRNNWVIQYLTWENMYCYGGDNCIDFSTLSGLNSIIGANGIGKSSVMRILILALFGVADEYSTICNVNATNWNLHLIFSAGEYQYMIKRWGNKTTKTLLSTNLALYKIEPLTDICTNISAKTIAETQAEIAKIIGDYQNFVDTNILTQNHLSYADASPASLTSAFTAGTHFHLLKLVREAAEDQAKQLRKKIKTAEELLSGIKPHISTDNLGALVAQRDSVSQQLEQVKDKLAAMPRIPPEIDITRYTPPSIPISTRDSLLTNLKRLRSNEIIPGDIPAMLDSLRLINSGLTPELIRRYRLLNSVDTKKLCEILGTMDVGLAQALEFIGLRQKYSDESLASIQAQCSRSIEQTENLLAAIKLRNGISHNLLPTVTLNEKTVMPILTTDILTQLNYLAHLPLNADTGSAITPVFQLETDVVTSLYSSAKYSDVLSTLRWNTGCECCKSNNTQLRQNITDSVIVTSVAYLSAIYTMLVNSLKVLRARKTKLANTFAAGQLIPYISLIEDLVNNQKINELQNIKILHSNIERSITHDISTLERISYLPTDLQLLVDRIGIEGVRQRFADLQKQNRDLLQQLTDVSTRIGAIQTGTTLATSASEAEAGITKMTGELEIVNTYIGLLDPEKGIIADLLTEYTDQLNKRINTILTYLTNFQIRLVVEKKVISAKLEHNHQPISVASGAQRFIIDVAIRIALMQQSSSTCNLLIIDEGFGSLDTKHIVQIQDFLKLLGEYYRTMQKTIIYVSHIDELNEISQNKLSIAVGGTSQLSNISRESHNILAGKILRYSNNKGANASSYANDIELREGKPYCKYCEKSLKSVIMAEKHILTKTHKAAFSKAGHRNDKK